MIYPLDEGARKNERGAQYVSNDGILRDSRRGMKYDRWRGRKNEWGGYK